MVLWDRGEGAIQESSVLHGAPLAPGTCPLGWGLLEEREGVRFIHVSAYRLVFGKN